MFIDKVKINISSGRGGNGVSTFRQEKFVAFGGPDGGDGGKGGSVYLEASNEMSTLLDFKYKSVFKAEDGSRGARKNQTGKSGEDLIIKVPLGTIVRDPEAELTIADLTELGKRVLVADGGRGGRGNVRFKSNKDRVPNYCEPGEPPVERSLELELKMIADVGIIGYPNAGKSTLISKLSAAKPKIADYAFTTLVPNLGVVRKQDGDAFVMADIPGLIEGASDGHGLGHQFLRHIERTRLLVHVVDIWGLMGSNIEEFNAQYNEDPLHNFIQVNYELDRYSQKLSQRKQIIVLNKIEGYPDDELVEQLKRFEDYTGLDTADQSRLENFDINSSQFLGLFAISNLSGEGFNANYERHGNGLEKLQRFIETALDLLPAEESDLVVDFDPIATDHDDSEFKIHKEDQSNGSIKWLIHCGKLERVMKVTDIRDLDALHHLFKVTKGIGVINAIKEKGAQEGDTLNIDGVDFDITEAVLI